MALIECKNVVKTFRIKRRDRTQAPGSTLVRAVDGVSFDIAQGEIVGYLGPNGAGKSTTIKMLAGILVPTSGSIEVGGMTPHRNRSVYCRQIGTVFGQRTQLWWDLPVQDSYEFNKRIYKISDAQFRRNVDACRDVLGISEFYDIPVRQLSLGQRVRAEIGASLLHNPAVLFLDEPTIGLDVLAKSKIREHIRGMNVAFKTTVILTTHDLADIESLCQRIIIIDRGKVIFDGDLGALADAHRSPRKLRVEFVKPCARLDVEGAETCETDDPRVWEVHYAGEERSMGDLMSWLLARYEVKDMSTQDVTLTEIITEIYESCEMERTKGGRA